MENRNKSFMLIGVILLAVALVGCTIPAGTQSIISADKLTLDSGATYWRVTDYTGDQNEDIAFVKGTSKTLADGTKATFTSDITIKIRPISSKLLAPPKKLITIDSSSPSGELLYSRSNSLCGVESYGTGITPFYFGQKDIQVKYSVEVLENGVRVADGYREVTWGGAGTTPQDELLLANGRVKLNNIAMLSRGVPYPELADVVWLPAEEYGNGGNFAWTVGKSKTAFMQRFMTICNGQRWECGGTNCYSDFRSTWLPALPDASGYVGTGAVFKGFYDGSTVWWQLDASRVSALITITVSTDLGTLVVKPNVKKPKIDEVQCDSLVQGQTGSGNPPDIRVFLSTTETPKIMGEVEVSAQATNSYVGGNNPTNVRYYSVGATGFISSANVVGTDTITVKACGITSFPDLPIVCDTKTCTRTVKSIYVCGNGLCEAGESQESCPNDCKTPPTCNLNNICEAGEPSDCKDCMPPVPPIEPGGGISTQTIALIGGAAIVLYLLFGRRRR